MVSIHWVAMLFHHGASDLGLGLQVDLILIDHSLLHKDVFKLVDGSPLLKLNVCSLQCLWRARYLIWRIKHHWNKFVEMLWVHYFVFGLKLLPHFAYFHDQPQFVHIICKNVTSSCFFFFFCILLQKCDFLLYFLPLAQLSYVHISFKAEIFTFTWASRVTT